jgi:hypothetical protein
MTILQRLGAAAALSATMALGACSDSLSPDTVDPQSLSTNLSTLTGTFDNNAAFVSLRTLSSSFPVYNATLFANAGTAALDLAAHPGTADRSRALRLLAGIRGATGIEALFPANLLGKTLVWDTDSVGYVVSAQAGAPANGIRLILYVADPNTGQPYLPLTPIGNLDLTDESNPSADQLGVLIKTVGGLTVADYTISVVNATNSATVTAAGYVRSGDGAQQANFNISVAVTQESLNVHVVIVGSEGTAVEFTVTLTSTAVTLDFALARDHNTIAFHAVQSTASSTVVGEIRFNGTVVARISGAADNPSIVPAEGFNLSGEDIATLIQLFHDLGDFINHFVDGVFAPTGIVFGGSITL